MRFKDPTLIRILQTMRVPGGRLLTDSEWQALLATELDDHHPSAAKPDVTGWYHTSYVWTVIAMSTFVQARESARSAQKTLFYIQAVDMPANLRPTSTSKAARQSNASTRIEGLCYVKSH